MKRCLEHYALVTWVLNTHHGVGQGSLSAGILLNYLDKFAIRNFSPRRQRITWIPRPTLRHKVGLRHVELVDLVRNGLRRASKFDGMSVSGERTVLHGQGGGNDDNDDGDGD